MLSEVITRLNVTSNPHEASHTGFVFVYVFAIIVLLQVAHVFEFLQVPVGHAWTAQVRAFHNIPRTNWPALPNRNNFV